MPDASSDHAPMWPLLKRLFVDHVRPYLRWLVFGVACMILVALGTALNAWMLEPLLDQVFLAGDALMLWLVPLALLLLAAVRGLANFGQAVLVAKVGLRVVADLQHRLYAHLLRSDPAWFAAQAPGTVIARCTYDVNLLRNAAASTLVNVGKDGLTLIFLSALMFYQDWRLALIALIVLPAAMAPLQHLARRMRRTTGRGQRNMGLLTARLDETLRGIRQIKADTRETFEIERTGAVVEQQYKLQLRSAKIKHTPAPMIEALGGLTIALVVLYGGHRVLAEATTPGAFFSFIAAMLMTYQPFKSLAKLHTTVQEGVSAAQRVFALLDMPPRIHDAPDARPLVAHSGAIRIERVDFAYRPGQPALNDISLNIPAGHQIALVGPSGAGKSTLLNLLPRFFTPDHGRILIDDQPIERVTLTSLRAAIAYVSQDVVLFDDTVRSNLLYGRPDASEGEMITAARDAAAHDFITALPEGYDTRIGTDGITLSGGQRQRLAIARAMVKNAPILLLDEATSALDSESERAIQRALHRLMRGRTTLVIAHRLSTVADADRIVVMDYGRLVEQGTHHELLARDGAYARLHALQFAAAQAPATALARTG